MTTKSDIDNFLRKNKDEKEIESKLLEINYSPVSDDSSGSDEHKATNPKRKAESDEEYVPFNVKKIKTEPKLQIKRKAKPSSSKAKLTKLKSETAAKSNIEHVEKPPANPRGRKAKTIELSDDQIGMEWSEQELLAEMEQINVHIAGNIIRLFKEENTIPFIARYRKEMTDNMEAEKLRNVKESVDTIRAIKQRALTVRKSIANEGKLTPNIEQLLNCARSIPEIENIYAPYKPGRKHTLAEQARELGLENPAVTILEGTDIIDTGCLIVPGKKGLSNKLEVETGLQHIIADIISKERVVLEKLRELKKTANLRIECKKSKATKSTEKKANDSKAGGSKQTLQEELQKQSNYQIYFDYSNAVRNLKPHQVLAINRAETQKVISVKITVPDWINFQLRSVCCENWLSKGINFPLRKSIFDRSFQDAYSRLLLPLLVREVRAELTKEAHKASIDVFALNLKKLLLTPPLRGKTVLGIDPGFKNGCKMAVVSPLSEILETAMIYPHWKQSEDSLKADAKKLNYLITTYKCEIIAIGNGTACRETETFISSLIQNGSFHPVDVTYTIVSEQGASIYSCSSTAKKEFPNMDSNFISAVSIARRLQDPIAEYVKVEPKHLGVGMYQHDIPEKQLTTTLEEVVVECVSFVGVDLNTASEVILRHIAGLSAARAAKLIEWRQANGPFTNRLQIKQVKGIGPKTFEQCCGFIRIIPTTVLSNLKSSSSKLDFNPLDQTLIHPESYEVALKFLKKCQVSLQDLGKSEFIAKVKSFVDTTGTGFLAKELGIPEAQITLISTGLQMPPDHDVRSEFQKPLFRKSIKTLESIAVGNVLTGRVQNVAHFGAFVDIGVEKNGLIHTSKMMGQKLQLGDKVEVKVESFEVESKRIGLRLLRIL